MRTPDESCIWLEEMEFLVTSDIFPELRHQHIKISAQLHLIEAQKRHEKSPKKDISSSQILLLGWTPHIGSPPEEPLEELSLFLFFW